MRLSERVRARRDAARERADRRLAYKLGGTWIQIPRTWLRGPLPPSETTGGGATPTRATRLRASPVTLGVSDEPRHGLAEGAYVAQHDDAAANVIDVHAAAVAASAQVLTRLENPHAGEFLTIAQDLRRWASTPGIRTGGRGRLRLVQ
jgi:hypothetical protein